MPVCGKLITFCALILVACNAQNSDLQKEVLTHQGIDSIYESFDKVSYQELPSYYTKYTDPNDQFKSKLKDKTYLAIKGDEIYTNVVGHYKLDNFLTTDFYYSQNKKSLEKDLIQYTLLDIELLYLILDFILELEEKGLNKYGFNVRESHRHPFYNYAKGGASQSQHIYGTAADLTIQDINNDGIESDEDKEIALEILEQLVDDKGGMGLYPGTKTIHIDTRGYRARW